MEAVGLLLWLVLERTGTRADEQVQLAAFDLFLEHPEPGLLTRVEDFIQRVIGLSQLDGRPFVVVPKRPELVAVSSAGTGALGPAILNSSRTSCWRCRWFLRRTFCSFFSRAAKVPYLSSVIVSSVWARTMA